MRYYKLKERRIVTNNIIIIVLAIALLASMYLNNTELASTIVGGLLGYLMKGYTNGSR